MGCRLVSIDLLRGVLRRYGRQDKHPMLMEVCVVKDWHRGNYLAKEDIEQFRAEPESFPIESPPPTKEKA